MQSRCCIKYVCTSGRPSSGHRTAKGQSSSQFPRRVVLKNVLIIKQLHSSPMLVRSSLKSCILGLSIMGTNNFQMFNLDLEKVEEPEIKLPTLLDHKESQGIPKKHLPLFQRVHQSLWLCRNKLWKALKEMGVSDHLTYLLRNLYVGQEATVESYMEQLIGLGLRKEYNRAVCCLLPCLTYMMSTSWEMPGWVCYKLDQDRWEKYQQFQRCGWYYPNSRKWRRTKEVLDEGEEGEWKSWVKTI